MNFLRRDYERRDFSDLSLKKPASFWERERDRRLIRFFQNAARQVPAYKDYLKKHRVDPQKIRTIEDFKQVPLISKKEYLQKYPLEKLVWPGAFRGEMQTITSTSGSTGEPFYFPRNENLDWAGALVHEMFLRQSSKGAEGPTLVIVGFSMGVWIAGLYTYKAFDLAAKRGGYDLSIITPGINKKEILNALRKLSPNFRQTILVGYPPFLKDILDEAEAEMDLPKLNLRLLFAAEPFSETFRDHVCRTAGIKNPLLDTMNIYGTVELGAMAFETPLSILIRRLAAKKKWLTRLFPGVKKLPTLAQYNPLTVHFEAPEGQILLTGDNSIPLIRYAVGDRGGVFTQPELAEKLRSYGWKDSVLVDEKIKGKTANLPFVYVYERDDFSTTLYGLQIYPEVIREALLTKQMPSYLTGKFSMTTKFDDKQDQYLELNLELKKNKKVGVAEKKEILQNIYEYLRSKNSEFRELSNYLKHRAHPKLVFWPAEHPLHFVSGIKQKWVKK
jgi:phenylacetate-CoA ligase